MVDIIPKQDTGQVNLWKLLSYVAMVLVGLLLIYFLILGDLLEKSQLKNSELDTALLREKTPEKLKTEAEVITYKKKIEDFSKLIALRPETSKVFEFIESSSHPKIVFSKFDFSVPDLMVGKIQVSGQADNFEILDQQIAIFKSDPLVSSANLDTLSLAEKGKVDFAISIFIKLLNEAI